MYDCAWLLLFFSFLFTIVFCLLFCVQVDPYIHSISVLTFVCIGEKRKGKKYLIVFYCEYMHMIVWWSCTAHVLCARSHLLASIHIYCLLFDIWIQFFSFLFLFFSSRFMLKLTIVSLPLCTCVVLFLIFFTANNSKAPIKIQLYCHCVPLPLLRP